jgi:hypothetical protein
MDDPVLRVQSQLTSRDRILLGWLYDHGVLTTFQLAHALFPSLDFCQRRMRTLYRLRLVARFRPQRADGGSYPYHWVIDQLGAEVVAAARNERPPRRDHARVERRRWASTRTLDHRLGVNQFFTDLAGHARTHPGAHLDLWLPEAACQNMKTFYRPGDSPLMLVHQPRVRPDGYGRWADAGRTGQFFLEYDTGTEQLSTLVDKISGYHELFDALGRTWPVLFWLHSAVRERNLRTWLADQPAAVLAATGSRDHAEAEALSPADAVWLSAADGHRRVALSALDDLHRTSSRP